MRVPKEEYIHDGGVVPWEAMERYHDAEENKSFHEYFYRQTMHGDGAWADDYERWLRTL